MLTCLHLLNNSRHSRMHHFDEIDFFQKLKWQAILHVFMKNLYSKMNDICEIKGSQLTKMKR